MESQFTILPKMTDTKFHTTIQSTFETFPYIIQDMESEIGVFEQFSIATLLDL